MHSKLGACYHQGVAHVVAGIPHVYQLNALQVSEMLTDSQHISKHLSRMILICQTVPNRNTCVFGKLFYDVLAKSTVLDTIIHSSKNSCSICNALFLADLGTCWIQIGASHSKVMSCNLEGAACSCAGFFKDQGNVFAFVILSQLASFFLCL